MEEVKGDIFQVYKIMKITEETAGNISPLWRNIKIEDIDIGLGRQIYERIRGILST